ncbi:MAG: hypothetical protein II835_03520 [Fibrobacter sp.]|nr:hypothetical protein [Fibrobacter sp.]
MAIELDENWLREELLLFWNSEELLATELTEFGLSVPRIEDDDSAIGAIGEDDSSGEHAIKARVVTAVMGKNFLIIK